MRPASLPMYGLPELEAVNDGWWHGLARHFERAGLRDVPGRLIQPEHRLAHWRDPNLLFSQTCGYPLINSLDGWVKLLATPCYTAAGCTGANYRSVLVVASSSTARALADMQGSRCVVNEPTSHSGYNILRSMVAPLAQGDRFFENVAVSGSHRRSIEMVGTGIADLAAVDCVTYGLLEAHAPAALAGTRSLSMSPAAPALPYITGGRVSDNEVTRLRAGLSAACADPALADIRAALLLDGVMTNGSDSYQCIREYELQASNIGYPKLA